MNEVFEPGSVDVVEFVGGDDLDVGQQKGRIQLRVNEAAREIAAGQAR
jgi:hypothetical protein